jgi:2-oxoisovalerate dehydrogenase E1 component
MPWDIESVVASARKTGRVIVAHEDSHSAGMGAEVLATIAERVSRPVASRRVTRADTYVPCNFANQLEVLPSYRRILETAVELLDGEIHWKQEKVTEAGVELIEAIGSSPSDESVTVVEWLVAPGDEITEGQVIAELEADKAAVELRSPSTGTVESFLVERGDMVKVGTPLIRLRRAETDGEEDPVSKPPTREEPGTPLISGIDVERIAGESKTEGKSRSSAAEPAETGVRPVSHQAGAEAERADLGGYILSVAGEKGSRTVTNADVIAMGTPWEEQDIVRRTGIETRQWLGENETAVDLAVRASIRALDRVGIPFTAVSSIICATETPQQQTPATATLVQYHLRKHYGVDEKRYHPPAYDVNAACTGYLYALQLAYDQLTGRPGEVILVLTAEALSPRLDMTDPGTAPIFGDAATATVVTDARGIATHLGSDSAGVVTGAYRYHRPVIHADGESGELLFVPANADEPIRMEGPRVFQEAVRDMIAAVKRAAATAGVDPAELDLIVPHQANQRIINAVRQRMKARSEQVYSNIRHNGNTSSSTIPLCLEEILHGGTAGNADGANSLGLTAFGGGFTYGAAILQRAK